MSDKLLLQAAKLALETLQKANERNQWKDYSDNDKVNIAHAFNCVEVLKMAIVKAEAEAAIAKATGKELLTAAKAAERWIAMYLGKEGHDAAAQAMLDVLSPAIRAAEIELPKDVVQYLQFVDSFQGDRIDQLDFFAIRGQAQRLMVKYGVKAQRGDWGCES